MKAIYKSKHTLGSIFILLLLAFSTLWYSCDDVDEDVLDAPDEITEILEFNANIRATSETPGILDLDEMRGHAEFSEFNISADPKNGIISFTDDLSKLIYVPNEDFDNGEDGFIISALNEKSETILQNAVRVVVESTNGGSGSGSSNGVFTFGEMSLASDTLFVVDLLDNDVFKDMPYQGSRAVKITDVSSNTDGLNISVFPGPNRSSEEAWLTYSPPPGFTGEVEFIYELCFGFAGKECTDDLFTCANYPAVCEYSTNTQAKIVVKP